MLNGVQQGIEASPSLQHTLPVSFEARQRLLFDGLHFAAQTRQRLAPDQSQHLDIAPLAVDPSWTEPSFHDPAVYQQPVQRAFHLRSIERKTRRDLAQGEGSVGSGV